MNVNAEFEALVSRNFTEDERYVMEFIAKQTIAHDVKSGKVKLISLAKESDTPSSHKGYSA